MDDVLALTVIIIIVISSTPLALVSVRWQGGAGVTLGGYCPPAGPVAACGAASCLCWAQDTKAL